MSLNGSQELTCVAFNAGTAASEASVDTSTPHVEASATEGTIPFPSSGPEQRQISSRTSWFGSLSRARGKDTTKSADPPSRPTAQEALGIPIATHDEGVRNTPPPPSDPTQDLVSSQDTIRPQSIPIPRPSVQVTGELSTMSSPQIVPSPSLTSVDEEVPRPRLSAGSPPMEMPRAEVQPQDGRSMGRKPSISDLNPSTSRFTLRIPLLGRPKVPLQDVVKNAEVSAQVDGSTPGRSDVAQDATGWDAAGRFQFPAMNATSDVCARPTTVVSHCVCRWR